MPILGSQIALVTNTTNVNYNTEDDKADTSCNLDDT